MDSIQVLKHSTKENYRACINKFDSFCSEKYNCTITGLLNEVRSIKQEERDDVFLSVLQDFVNWMVSVNVATSTVNQYIQIITYYFSYYGIRIHSIDIRRHIKKPKKIHEKLHSVTKEEVIQILDNSIEKRKMLYLVLIGTGMRIQECVSLRKKDFDLKHAKRIKIDIPAIHTKTQTAHTTFVSKEAENFLRPRLESLSNNDLVFATNDKPFHAKMTEIDAFSRTRKKVSLIEKYDSTNRHKISLHSFRSYFFTRARRIHDTDIAHAMVGHTTYLGMYDRKDDAEKLELFLKVEPELAVGGDIRG
ncbi:tyrosine-type recombinase/integrase [Nitrosopumilus adriaticus]|uniref:tyrosine-type recombinase/integrase n=1 Tax=Nitrosopumilus adriaticus TaxID=1580092 RepID=UPI00352FC86A